VWEIPGYELPWEDKSFVYPSNLASPLDIEIKASDGASDYGNKYGEPVIHGFTRSFGQRLPSGERFEWVKPIMFSAGVGQMDSRFADKGAPEKGMLVIKIGGPAYRIGIGGGAASSRVQSSENADLDFDAVQRGDAEMENRMNRLMRACCDLGDNNPIVSVHDQGAGGNGNILKELVEPAGASYDIRKVSEKPSGSSLFARCWTILNMPAKRIRSKWAMTHFQYLRSGAQNTKKITAF
jgi:phosphoribosylformylglycinamidine synthase